MSPPERADRDLPDRAKRDDGFVRCPICSYILPPGSVIGGCTCGHAFWDGEGANPHIPPCAEARERPCLYADVADGGCALRATADSPPPTAVQLRECVLRIRALEAALTVVTLTDSLDQARGIAHAALNREEYHGEATDA